MFQVSARSRVIIAICVVLLTGSVQSQVVLDGWFINERFVSNTQSHSPSHHRPGTMITSPIA